jgi:membrane-bound serine protease (ClpP class)
MQGAMDTIMMAKATNDAAAFVRTIAQQRKRNVEWAEEAVRNSVSITASEALEKNVVDFVSADRTELLKQMDGRTVEVQSRTVTLDTKEARRVEIPMSFGEKLMNVISDPNIAYILLILGFYGIFFELYNPGAIVPGVVGVIAMILGFYALNTLPINYAGLALILFGIVLFLLEIKITSYGILTIGGIISLALGSSMLIRPDTTFAFPGIAGSIIITTTLVTASFFLFIVGMGMRAQRRKPFIGAESLSGETAIAVDDLEPDGSVHLHGEIWKAELVSGAVKAGEKVRVIEMKDLILYVEPFKTS